MNLPVRKFLFRDQIIRTFYITRLADSQVEEKVLLKQKKQQIDITLRHSMICLDPFCVAAWLTKDELGLVEPNEVNIRFVKDNKLNAVIKLKIIATAPTENGALLLYHVKGAKNYQLSALHRLVLFRYFLRSKKNTYYHRKVVSALYSYPRKIIIVSYQDDNYYNIFPMDIQGYIRDENLYILGLRTTNVTLDRILEAKKVVICDTDAVDIETVYNLGKHSSSAPTPKEKLPFGTTPSELFGFPVPDFAGSYKEVEIISNRKMGYHMLMVGKVVNAKEVKTERSSLYHVGFLQFQDSDYESIEGLF
ncbi:MAG: hypothetical protein JST19_17060 [Bacteroidetes bacterium]|nr:hypothetical protein [Bacteroidota bacterium]